VLLGDLAQALQIARGGMSTPVEPATGSTITAAMVEASCSVTMRSSSSASSSAMLGQPFEKAFLRQVMGVRHVVDAASSVPNILRLVTMPPTEMPPKLTP
jgi:hypothetical protein